MLDLPPIIPERLQQYERGRKLLVLLRGLAEVLLVFCGGLLLLVFIEWAFKPAFPTRGWLSALNYCATGAVAVWRLILPLVRRASLRQVARNFEQSAAGHFRERILSAVEMAEVAPESQPGVSAWMMQRTIALAAEEIGTVKPALLLDRAPAVKAWKTTVAAMAILARLWLALSPYAPTAPLFRLQLTVSPGDCHVKQGAPLEIKALGPNLPDDLKAVIRWDDGFRETVPMSRSGTNEFALPLSSVSQGFRYSVQAADAESVVFSVKVDTPPRVAHLQTVVEYPAYTLSSNRVIEGGSAEFPVGSRVRLVLETADEKVAQAEWIPDLPASRRFEPESSHLTVELQPTNALTYQIKLTGVNKLESLSSQKWSLRPVADGPPTAALTAIGAEPGMVQRDEILPLQAGASDDIGLKRVDLVAFTRDIQADLKPLYSLGQGMPSRNFIAPINYDLAELRLATGDEVQLQVVATDLLGQSTRSEPLSFTIGGLDKALEAQLALRLKQMITALGTQIDDLQQTRASWLSIARNYREDTANSQGPALAVLQSRLDEFGREIAGLGNWLVAESETNDCSDARFMYRLGTTISTWSAQQRDVLLANCAAIGQARGANLYAAFNLGRDLFSRALLNLEDYKKVVSVLQGVFETDVLATRCESAQGRYKRGLPVLRGDNMIAPLGRIGSGLMATFFEGVSLDGRVLEQKVENPSFTNYAPGGRRENWSARYEGDMSIPEAGEWTLACVADDGVRLAVDGKALLPANAWAPHPATQFKGDLQLPAGWHPVTIEFFQGSSESRLQFLAARKGNPLREVPAQWLRPPPGPAPNPELATNTVLSALVKDALKDRVKSSLTLPSRVPPALIPMTNEVHNQDFTRLVREKIPVGDTLSSNLQHFASWKPEDSQQAEGQADDLTVLSKDARRILRQELEKYRWHYEGAAALKRIQNSIEELREINQDLRRLPWHNKPARTEQEQARIELQKAWQKELEHATAEAAHQLFEVAKQNHATLAERVTALQATTKIEKELQPSVEKLGDVLEQDTAKDDMANRVEQQLNRVSNRYRELNDLQEKINREQVAADARQALPTARAFERAQRANLAARFPERYDQLKQKVAEVVKAQRVAGGYDDARKLQELAGDSLQNAHGQETARYLRELASRTDRNVPSLAQSIPPPMQQQTQELDQRKTSSRDAANELAKPRLGMALESARLAQQADRKTAVAYAVLGDDLGALIDTAPNLTASTLAPLADRAAALAGQKGEEARQAEIRSANERFREMAERSSKDAAALAGQLDEMSVLARKAAGDRSQRQPLSGQLADMGRLAPPVDDWSESTDPPEIASSAAHDSSDEIDAAPSEWASYNDASQMLAEAASQVRMQNALSDLAEANPYPVPAESVPGQPEQATASAQMNGSLEGPAGSAITQPPPKGIDQAEWARLNARLRQAIRSSGIENFSEEYQAAIRAYFERLSADSQSSTGNGTP